MSSKKAAATRTACAKNQVRLKHDTAAYFAALSPEAAREEKELGETLGETADEVDCET